MDTLKMFLDLAIPVVVLGYILFLFALYVRRRLRGERGGGCGSGCGGCPYAGNCGGDACRTGGKRGAMKAEVKAEGAKPDAGKPERPTPERPDPSVPSPAIPPDPKPPT